MFPQDCECALGQGDATPPVGSLGSLEPQPGLGFLKRPLYADRPSVEINIGQKAQGEKLAAAHAGRQADKKTNLATGYSGSQIRCCIGGTTWPMGGQHELSARRLRRPASTRFPHTLIARPRTTTGKGELRRSTPGARSRMTGQAVPRAFAG